jgi:signal transduction histidine kinase/ActR/RegA family two-component response regulator
VFHNPVGFAAAHLPSFEDLHSQSHHFVQFYDADSFLIDSVLRYLSAGLYKDEGAIVVLTEDHLQELKNRLNKLGIDVDARIRSGQLVCLDAKATLEEIDRAGNIRSQRIVSQFDDVIRRASEGRPGLRVVGEMVALLWAEDRHETAIELEEFWDELKERWSFSLFCSYPMSGMAKHDFADPLKRVFALHSHVIPAESYTALNTIDERLRAITLLQQKARSLETEIGERDHAEDRLRLLKDELENQVADLARLHRMSLSLNRTLDMDSILNEVLTAALEVQGTDKGMLMLGVPGRDGVQVRLSRGFDDDFVREVNFIPSGSGSCGTSYQRKERVVIEDFEIDSLGVQFREVARKGGFQACHSTPLISRSGAVVGVLSAHFTYPKRPTERETRLMDLYAGMAADIIENAQLHQQVQQEVAKLEGSLVREQIARGEAESANRMKDEFLATVSHELRTPLNAIIGWSHMLREGRLDAQTSAKALETIERNAQSQAQLVEDILDVSRVVTGKLSLKMSMVDLALVINTAVDSVQSAADSKKIAVEVTIDPSARQVLGDVNRLQQIVWNLLSNAIKFTPVSGKVAVRLGREGANIQIRVSDSGQGIAPEFLPFVFDRFRQADATSTRRHGGLGLGLSIVRYLAELHGGLVSVESAGVGHGATFTVSLPSGSKRKTRRPSSTRSAVSREIEESMRLKALPSLKGVRILLVDDDADSVRLITTMLADHGALVQSCLSAAKALEVMDWYRPDVMVLDLAMPDEDGFSLIRKLRDREAVTGKVVPAVALTAHVRIEDRARALSAGFNMFVPKPVEIDELITAIANVASK